jgi:hypothetical protein
MTDQNARLTILRLIGQHGGEWGWYQFEQAFPPGWFSDVPPGTRAMDILKQLEADGLVCTTPGTPQRKYVLTDQGQAALRQVESDAPAG